MVSDWPVTSGALQDSVLLFIICTNYLDFGMSSDVSKFPDDTKVGRLIQFDQDACVLQREVRKYYERAGKWQRGEVGGSMLGSITLFAK